MVTIMPTPAQEIFLQNYPLRGEQRTRSTLSSRPWSLPKWTMPLWPRLDGQWSLGELLHPDLVALSALPATEYVFRGLTAAGEAALHIATNQQPLRQPAQPSQGQTVP